MESRLRSGVKYLKRNCEPTVMLMAGTACTVASLAEHSALGAALSSVLLLIGIGTLGMNKPPHQ